MRYYNAYADFTAPFDWNLETEAKTRLDICDDQEIELGGFAMWNAGEDTADLECYLEEDGDYRFEEEDSSSDDDDRGEAEDDFVVEKAGISDGGELIQLHEPSTELTPEVVNVQ